MRNNYGACMKNDNQYKEAMSYMESARLQLNQAGKDGKFYIDELHVKSACGTAYLGMLKGLDFLFDIKHVPKKRGRKSIEYYLSVLSGIDERLYKHLNNGYKILYLYGYYDGGVKIGIIESGLDDAIEIIDALKSLSKNGN